MPELVPLQGSERAELPGATPAGELDTSSRITVTVIVRRRASVPAELITGPHTLTSAELAEQYGSDPADVALATELVGQALDLAFAEVCSLGPELRLAKRQEKFRNMGRLGIDFVEAQS